MRKYTTLAAALALHCWLPGCGTSTTAETAGAADTAQAGDTPQTADTAPADDVQADAANDTTPSLPQLVTVTGDANFAVAANGWYRGDLHFHTNYSEDALKQGGDDLKDALVIADAWRDPIYTNAHPGTAGNGLDYVAVTDHRTDAALHDPEFKHDHLIVVPGEEFGGTGHAGIWGLKKHITGDPTHGESPNQRIQDAINEAHADGALFSPNHPTQDNNWVWDVTGYDALEVWNGPWSAFYGPTTEADVEARAKGIGAEGPFIRQAAAEGQGGGSNAQAMMFWQFHLSAGRHIAPVGGGDRHMLLPPGLPTTYVHQPRTPAFAGKSGKEIGPEGITGGITARETFVSRSPLGAQVELAAEGTDGTLHRMGEALVAGETYKIHVRVSRALGGRVRLYTGPLLEKTGGKGPDGKSPHATLAWEAEIPAALAGGEWTWTVPAGGAWLHAVVLEPLVVEPVPQTVDQIVEILTKLPEGKALGSMIAVFTQMVDASTLGDASTCDPTTWLPWRGECMPADKATWTTYYIPDGLVRYMSTWFEAGEPTAFCCGAVSSAFLAK